MLESNNSVTDGCSTERRFRPVERFVHHGAPLGFRALCRAAIPTSTRYVVLDLDRTLHLARNMGELLGWETGAYHSYGAQHLDAVEPERGSGRFLFSAARPFATSKYLYRGARSWAYPGLFYLLWGRMAGATALTRRLRARLFGADAYFQIQDMPRLALLHDLAGMDLAEARQLSARVFRRQVNDQVIGRADVEWLRQHCPGVQIVLSSASPQPVVEAAAGELGIDAMLFSESQVVDGRISAPYQMSPVFLHAKHPEHISPPSEYRVNGGPAKVTRLVAAFPDILSSQTVGITDTWHGDDHSWAQHFSQVIDINSISPFPPLVTVDSPVREIHSAQILTQQECEQHACGNTSYVSPRRKCLAAEAACDLDRTEIVTRIARCTSDAESLAHRHAQLGAELATDMAAVTEEANQAMALIEDIVADYNIAQRGARPRLLRGLGELVRKHNEVRRRQARVERPLSGIALDLSYVLAQCRTQLTAARN